MFLIVIEIGYSDPIRTREILQVKDISISLDLGEATRITHKLLFTYPLWH